MKIENLKSVGNNELNYDRIIDLLDRFGIEYRLAGKNISTEAIGLCCPFCNDNNYHLGVFKSTGTFSCWKCGTTGVFPSLLRKLTNLGYKDINQALSEVAYYEQLDRPFKTGVDIVKELIEKRVSKPKKKNDNPAIGFPDYCQDVAEAWKEGNELLKYFAQKRNFVIETLIRHNTQVCLSGKYEYRLVIPIYDNGMMVGFLPRDMTGNAYRKYNNPRGFPINDYLYDMEYFYGNPINRERIVIVEGVFDAWRVGKEAIATFGTHITQPQMYKLFTLKPKEIVISWDSDAYLKAKKVAYRFSPHFKTKIIKLPQGHDPDSLGRDAIYKLIENTVCI